MLRQAPHSHTARLFMNWILTKEGQTVWSRSIGFVSRRVNISSDWIDSEYRRKPGVKYLIDDEDSILRKDDYVDRLYYIPGWTLGLFAVSPSL